MARAADKRPIGRPSIYTEALADEICSRLAKGEPLARICRDDHMPNPSTVWTWRQADAILFQRIARARDDGFDAIATDCLDIADDTGNDTKYVGKEGEERETCNTEWVQRSKLRIETRLKLLAKWDPKRYGERSQVELTGKDGEALKSEVHIFELPDNGRGKPAESDET